MSSASNLNRSTSLHSASTGRPPGPGSSRAGLTLDSPTHFLNSSSELDRSQLEFLSGGAGRGEKDGDGVGASMGVDKSLLRAFARRGAVVARMRMETAAALGANAPERLADDVSQELPAIGKGCRRVFTHNHMFLTRNLLDMFRQYVSTAAWDGRKIVNIRDQSFIGGAVAINFLIYIYKPATYSVEALIVLDIMIVIWNLIIAGKHGFTSTLEYRELYTRRVPHVAIKRRQVLTGWNKPVRSLREIQLLLAAVRMQCCIFVASFEVTRADDGDDDEEESGNIVRSAPLDDAYAVVISSADEQQAEFAGKCADARVRAREAKGASRTVTAHDVAMNLLDEVALKFADITWAFILAFFHSIIPLISCYADWILGVGPHPFTGTLGDIVVQIVVHCIGWGLNFLISAVIFAFQMVALTDFMRYMRMCLQDWGRQYHNRILLYTGLILVYVLGMLVVLSVQLLFGDDQLDTTTVVTCCYQVATFGTMVGLIVSYGQRYNRLQKMSVTLIARMKIDYDTEARLLQARINALTSTNVVPLRHHRPPIPGVPHTNAIKDQIGRLQTEVYEISQTAVTLGIIQKAVDEDNRIRTIKILGFEAGDQLINTLMSLGALGASLVLRKVL
ncbi:hypothetical protein HK101_011468 [Irineochytrium annulatum]|nr:hypothetical protein HK101_011468 [Irineochytrium annulatum]